jgi:hypothetical protein
MKTMNRWHRASTILIAVALGACGDGTEDPLLFEADGALRSTVSLDEVQGANIPIGCEAHRALLSGAADVVQVEVAGEPWALIGVAGRPVCLENLSGEVPFAALDATAVASCGCYCTVRKQCRCYDAGAYGVMQCRTVYYDCCPIASNICWFQCRAISYGPWLLGGGLCVP